MLKECSGDKMINCEKHENTIICSKRILPALVKLLIENHQTIEKIELCDKGGYHIWLKE